MLFRSAYVDHRKEVIRRRTRFLLQKAEERKHIVEGLRIDAQATLAVGIECTPGDYPVVLRMPALGIAAEYLDADVYFPGKNKPEKWNAPDTLLVATVQVK